MSVEGGRAPVPEGGGTGPTVYPPALSEWWLRRVVGPLGAAGETMLGDLREEHAALVRSEGRRRADVWYRRQSAGLGVRVLRDRARRSGPFWWMSEPAGAVGRKRGGATMLEVWTDVKQATRSLGRAKQYAVAAVLTLALAIAANTVVFSVVNSVLLEPLPYPESGRLVILRHAAPGLEYPRIGVSPGLYHHYRENVNGFAESGLYNQVTVNLTGDAATPERVQALRATAPLFATLGVAPIRGRVFTAEEDAPDGPPAVVLSYALWQRRFGGAGAAIGRNIRVDGRERAVVGVMPEGFGFPDRAVELYLPLGLDLPASSPGNFAFSAVGRLNADGTVESAQAQMDGIVKRMGEFYPDVPNLVAFLESGRFTSTAAPLKDDVIGDLRRPLWILLGTAAFVLIIACANVTNLFLVRAEARGKDVAVRNALGAGRVRLARHFLAETAVLATLAGVFGLALGTAGVTALVGAAPDNIPRLDEVGVNAMVLGYTAGVVVVIALLLALLPALRMTSPSMLALVSRGARTTAGRERQRARQLLVVVQTALALVLLAGSGLMLRTFAQLRNVDPGFNANDVLTFRVALPAATYPDAAAAAALHERLLQRLRAWPGVQSAAAISDLPLAMQLSGTAFIAEGQTIEPGELPPMLWYTVASEDYFATLDIPVRQGESFGRADREATRQAVIVNASLAERFWPGQDPIGRRLRSTGDSTPWSTVIGVVGDVRERRLQQEPGDIVYFPMLSLPAGPDGNGIVARSMVYVVRANGVGSLMSAVRNEVAALDTELPITNVTMMQTVVAASIAQISFTMLALVIAASLALFLGAIGLYGVISYTVTQRTREIGVRMALGAEAGAVRRMVVLQGARLSAFGLVAGTVAAFGLTRVLESLLYGTSATDAVTFGSVVALLACVSLLACWVPALRAARVDPARTLQAE